MKTEERIRAIELRKLGKSFNEILQEVHVSKGTISLWLRDIELTQSQMDDLRSRRGDRGERFANSFHKKRIERWNRFKESASIEWESLKNNPEFMFGLALYVGEGNKYSPNSIGIVNCDYRVINSGISFFEMIGVDTNNITWCIHTHGDQNLENAIEFWTSNCGLRREKMIKPQIATPKSSNGRKITIHENGTCHIIYGNTEIRQKLERWMNLALSSS